ncbi:MAG: xanthine phosphoribosyltransferase [Lachnospiraceae bacterium]|jgi:xanthine phosphoribosyltransferase|nr:xanthine phosphoribosyltransferase [Lachnospiraceae bacterium]
MLEMEEKILKEGKVLPGGILKVGNFLNQQIDTAFLKDIGSEIARLYEGCGVTKILTIESSGIAIAVAAGMEMGVPVVFAKKHKTSNVDGSVYSTTVHSFTHGTDYTVVVSSDYLCRGDRLLLVDDFLANGSALRGLIDLAGKAGAELCGAAVAIEKGFQSGGDELRREGVRIESLAVIESMSDTEIVFRPAGRDTVNRT